MAEQKTKYVGEIPPQTVFPPVIVSTDTTTTIINFNNKGEKLNEIQVGMGQGGRPQLVYRENNGGGNVNVIYTVINGEVYIGTIRSGRPLMGRIEDGKIARSYTDVNPDGSLLDEEQADRDTHGRPITQSVITKVEKGTGKVQAIERRPVKRRNNPVLVRDLPSGFANVGQTVEEGADEELIQEAGVNLNTLKGNIRVIKDISKPKNLNRSFNAADFRADEGIHYRIIEVDPAILESRYSPNDGVSEPKRQIFTLPKELIAEISPEDFEYIETRGGLQFMHIDLLQAGDPDLIVQGGLAEIYRIMNERRREEQKTKLANISNPTVPTPQSSKKYDITDMNLPEAEKRRLLVQGIGTTLFTIGATAAAITLIAFNAPTIFILAPLFGATAGIFYLRQSVNKIIRGALSKYQIRENKFFRFLNTITTT